MIDDAYIVANIGFRMLSENEALDRMSLHSQVPSSRKASRTAAMVRSGRTMSWMQSKVSTRS